MRRSASSCRCTLRYPSVIEALSLGAAFLATIFSHRPARADDAATEAIRIAYDAPAECADRLGFFAEISSRTSRARPARRGESARTLRIRISRADDFSGELTIEESTVATSSARHVRAATCGEVVETLAFIAALAIDPTASIAPSHAPAPERTPASPAENDERAPPEASPAPASHPPPLSPSKDDVPHDSTPPPRGSRFRFGVGTQLEAAGLAVLVPSARIFADGELDRAASSVVAPSLRIAIARSLEISRAPSLGAATLRWTTASIEPCPLRVGIARGLAVKTCAGFTMGVLDATGSGIDNARSRTRPWFALSAQPRLSWELARVVELELEGGLTVPLVRESFTFAPEISVYTAPAIALFGRVGAAVHFP